MRFFNKISLSTPESVELDFLLAGIGSRAFALLIDYSILLLVWTAFTTLWSFFSVGLMSYITERSDLDTSGTPAWLLAIYVLVNFILWGGYFVAFETLWRGQTPGKRLTKIRVVRDDGRPVRLVQVTLRSLLRAIDDFLFIGVFFILFTKREKRIGDMAAGTLVIQEDPGDRKAEFFISPEAKQLAQKLPDLADLTQLIPDDYAIIREYLMRRGKMTAKSRTDKSMELARQLKTLVKLEEIPTGTTSDQFLEAVYVAYQAMMPGRE